MDHLDHLNHLDHLGHMDHLDQMDHPAHLDNPYHPEHSIAAAQYIPLQPAIFVKVVAPVTLSSLSQTA